MRLWDSREPDDSLGSWDVAMVREDRTFLLGSWLNSKASHSPADCAVPSPLSPFLLLCLGKAQLVKATYLNQVS